jgi:hypothetical protein
VVVDDLAGAMTVLHQAGIAANRVKDHLEVALAKSEATRISRTLAEHGHWICELKPNDRSLEELFLELTDGLELARTELMSADSRNTALKDVVR